MSETTLTLAIVAYDDDETKYQFNFSPTSVDVATESNITDFETKALAVYGNGLNVTSGKLTERTVTQIYPSV